MSPNPIMVGMVYHLALNMVILYLLENPGYAKAVLANSDTLAWCSFYVKSVQTQKLNVHFQPLSF